MHKTHRQAWKLDPERMRLSHPSGLCLHLAGPLDAPLELLPLEIPDSLSPLTLVALLREGAEFCRHAPPLPGSAPPVPEAAPEELHWAGETTPWETIVKRDAWELDPYLRLLRHSSGLCLTISGPINDPNEVMPMVIPHAVSPGDLVTLLREGVEFCRHYPMPRAHDGGANRPATEWGAALGPNPWERPYGDLAEPPESTSCIRGYN